MRGRDIKKYSYEFADLYVILAHFGTFRTIPLEYPAVYKHLKKHEVALRERGQCRYTSSGKPNLNNPEYPGQHHWLELDNNLTIEKLDDFSKQKITYIEIMTDNPDEGYDFPCFSFDTESCVVLNTAYIITGEVDELKYILGILNSKLGKALVKNYVAQLQQRQFRMLNQYVVNFPIPKSTNMTSISDLVSRIITDKKQARDTRQLEKMVNNLVYQLFDFNSEEIDFIDSQ